MQPLAWMRAVRDHQPKPPANSARFAVLWALALRMKADGTGFCSRPQLVNDVVVGVRTVERHLKWAREHGYLQQTRRGHRITDDTVIASEWALTQPVTGDALGIDPTRQTGLPNTTDGTTQHVTGDAPRGLLSRDPHPDAHARDGSRRNGGKPDRRGAGNGFGVGDEERRPLSTCPDCDRAFRPRYSNSVRCAECTDKAMTEYTKNAAKSGIPKCQVCRKPLTIKSEWDSRIYCPRHLAEWRSAVQAAAEGEAS